MIVRIPLLEFVEDLGKSDLEVFVMVHRIKDEESTNRSLVCVSGVSQGFILKQKRRWDKELLDFLQYMSPKLHYV